QAAAVAKQHRHCRDEQQHAAADRKRVDRDAEVRKHGASGHQEEERYAKCDHDGADQYLAPARGLLVARQRNEDWDDAGWVDYYQQRHQSREAESHEFLIHWAERVVQNARWLRMYGRWAVSGEQ